MKKSLQKKDTRSSWQKNGKEALQKVEKERPDLIVFDIVMPQMDGMEALGRIIGKDKTRPVLLLTSRPSKEESREVHPQKGEAAMSETEMKSPEEKPEKKKAYQEKIEAQLNDWGARIDELKARATTSKAELKTKYGKQIEDLRSKQEVVQQKLREFKESGGETWEHLKTGMEKSLGELKVSLDRSLSKFKEMGGETAEKMSGKKRIYEKKMEAQLKEWGSQINLLKAKAEKSKVGARVTYLKQVEELRRKQKSAKEKLRELRGSGDEAWEDFKGGVEEAVKDLKTALKRAAARFKK
jgi:CheY-like chemotaxis protein